IQTVAGFDLREERRAVEISGGRSRDAGKNDIASDRRVAVGRADCAFDVPASGRVAGVGRNRERVDSPAAGDAARAKAATRRSEGDARLQRGIKLMFPSTD